MLLLRRKCIEPTDTIGLCRVEWEGVGLIDGAWEVGAWGERVRGRCCAEGPFGFLFFLVLEGVIDVVVGGGTVGRRGCR